MFKTLLDNLGTILGVFGILNFFNFFNNLSKTRPSMEHWAKLLFEKVNPTLVQNTFAHFWERFWAIMEVWKIFHFLKTFRRLDLPWNTGQKNFSEKLPQNMFKTRLDTFGNDFVQLWNFEKFLIFWKHFEDSTIHGTLGKNFFRKNYPKTCSKHVWTIWERFWAFLEIWKVFSFFTKTFRRLDTPWNTGQKIFFEKITPKTCSKHVWTVFGNDFRHFWKFENFLIFWKHFEDSNLHGTLGKKIFQKKFPKTSSKHVWTLLGTIVGIFGNFEIFSNFWKHFEDSILHGTLGKKKFRKKYLKTCSKRVCALLWTILGFFGILKVFWFFKNISKTRPSMQHCAKRNFRKKYPKTCSKHFWTIWERFWAFLEFWKFFDFLKTFRRLDPPWNTG